MNKGLIYNIFIVDDHQLVIDGISSLLKGSEQFNLQDLLLTRWKYP